jgi:hypothetical protein
MTIIYLIFSVKLVLYLSLRVIIIYYGHRVCTTHVEISIKSMTVLVLLATTLFSDIFLNE